MKKSLFILLSCCISFYVSAQGICNPDGNIIIYSNYNGGTIQINIDEDVPDIKIGLCSYESWDITITGDYIENVVEVVYAGYDDDATTSITGVDPGIVEIRVIDEVTLEDTDGYPYMICAYECDTDYVPGGCNTVDQLTDYFLTEFTGTFRFSYLQYDVFDADEYYISEGGNCCFDGTSGPAPADVAITAITSPEGGCNLTGSETVTATITNYGPATVESIPVSLSVDGGSSTTETAYITLEAGESGDYTFSETADLSAAGLHNIFVSSEFSGDSDPTNDTYELDVLSLESPVESLDDNVSGCDEITLDAGNPGATYNWSTGATTQTIVVTESGTYSVTTNLTGCTITESIAVTVDYYPIASFTYTDVGLTITFTNTSTDADSYSWNFGDGTTSTAADPTHTFDTEGEYTITLTVTNECGTDVYTTVVQVTTAIQEDIVFANTQVYPNPTSGIISVEMTLDNMYPVELCIKNLQGELILQKNIGIINHQKIDLNLSSLESGTYNLLITAGTKSCVRRLTILK